MHEPESLGMRLVWAAQHREGSTTPSRPLAEPREASRWGWEETCTSGEWDEEGVPPVCIYSCLSPASPPVVTELSQLPLVLVGDLTLVYSFEAGFIVPVDCVIYVWRWGWYWSTGQRRWGWRHLECSGCTRLLCHLDS